MSLGVKMVKFLVVLVLFLGIFGLTRSDKNKGIDVVELHDTNFDKLVGSSDKIWIIKFYVPWCGACLQFAPVFSELIRNIQGWGGLFAAGQISCPANSELCGQYGVKQLPAVKIILPGKNPLESVLVTAGFHDIDSLETSLVDELDELQQSDPIRFKTLPFLGIMKNYNDIDVNNSKIATFLIVEESSLNSSLGKLVIMDNLKYSKQLKVYRTTTTYALENKIVLQIGLYQVAEGMSFKNITCEFTRSGLNIAIALDIGKSNPSNDASSKGPHKTVPIKDKKYVYKKAHGLHMADLITNLRYSLYTEVSALPVIDAKAHDALQKYLYILILYHPADSRIIKFLQNLYDWLVKNPAPVTSKQWLEALQTLEEPDAYIPANTTWVGCKGTKDNLRGYPCSAWMTYHVLTLRAYLDFQNVANVNTYTIGLEILMAIRGYVEHFFGCRECSENFVYYSRNLLNETSEYWPVRRAVLDLWRRHNAVNERLHLQPATEDPKFPKIQFPSVEDCQNCRKHIPYPFSVYKSKITDWNEDEVFQFLLGYYGSSKISSCTEKGKVVHVGEWSSCSKTCDTGVSLRLSNNNPECDLQYETRLCFERPCTLKIPDWSRTPLHRAMCPLRGHTYQLSVAKKLEFNGCVTNTSEKWKICGRCPRRGVGKKPICCKPIVSDTKRIDVLCAYTDPVEDGHGVWLNKKDKKVVTYHKTKMLVETIELCECSEESCRRD